MSTRITLFNHKGGVSKTTTTFNLGWMLAEKGYKVLLVDTDPQCNLTGLVIGYENLESFFQNHTERNIRSGLTPAFEAQPKLIEPIECIVADGIDGLYLLPGHINLSEYEVTLGFAQELSGSLQALKNLPGAISYLLEVTAEEYQADYILVDTSPSVNSINQNVVMTGDYFLLPSSPDYFSVMALDGLTTVLPRWGSWAQRARDMKALSTATYRLPDSIPRFLGTIIQNYRPRQGRATRGFQRWIDEINSKTTQQLVPELQRNNLTLPRSVYEDAGVMGDYCLATIPDFNTLVANSQEHRTPIFALSDEQIGQAGVVLETQRESARRFHRIFSELADRIVEMTSDASSS